MTKHKKCKNNLELIQVWRNTEKVKAATTRPGSVKQRIITESK